MRQIKVIWDFKGLTAMATAQHHVIHLKEFVITEQLPIEIVAFENINEMHSIAYLVVTDAHLMLIRDTLKPHRAVLYETF